MDNLNWLDTLLIKPGRAELALREELGSHYDAASAWERVTTGAELAWLGARLAGSRVAMEQVIVVAANLLLCSCLRPWVRTHLRAGRMLGAVKRAKRGSASVSVDIDDTDSAIAAGALFTAGAKLASAYSLLEDVDEFDWGDARVRVLPDRIYQALCAGRRALGYGCCASFGVWVGESNWADTIRARLARADVGDVYPRIQLRGAENNGNCPVIPLGVAKNSNMVLARERDVHSPVASGWARQFREQARSMPIYDDIEALGRHGSLRQAWTDSESPVALTYVAAWLAVDHAARCALQFMVAEAVEAVLDANVLTEMRSSWCRGALKRIARRQLTPEQAHEFIKRAEIGVAVAEAVHYLSAACEALRGAVWATADARQRSFAGQCACAVWHAERVSLLAASRTEIARVSRGLTATLLRERFVLVESAGDGVVGVVEREKWQVT